MEIISLGDGIGNSAIRAAGVLRRGGVILYPTDTLYGLGADAFSDEAVQRVYEIKGRDPQKPIHCVVSDLAMAAHYVEVNDAALKIAEKFLPGPLTLILKKKIDVQTGIARGMDTIGIRIPDDEFCIELARTFGKPYTTTSANRAGMPPAFSTHEIIQQLGDSASGIDLILDAGRLPERKPSTVVNLVSGFPSVLREGAIEGKEVLAVAV